MGVQTVISWSKFLEHQVSRNLARLYSRNINSRPTTRQRTALSPSKSQTRSKQPRQTIIRRQHPRLHLHRGHQTHQLILIPLHSQITLEPVQPRRTDIDPSQISPTPPRKHFFFANLSRNDSRYSSMTTGTMCASSFCTSFLSYSLTSSLTTLSSSEGRL